MSLSHSFPLSVPPLSVATDSKQPTQEAQAFPGVIDHTSGTSRALPKLKFNGSDRFLRELRKRIDAYFEKTGRRRRDCPQMYFKTATILTGFVTIYLLLMFFATSWFTVIPLAILLGLAVAAIGFNIQHDAGHKAYSEHRWINRTMAFTLDLMGGSSYMWDWKHNTIHHTYPNVDGYDDDINIGFLGRLSPQQPRYAFHRFQGIYLWILYGFIAIKWHLVDDFYNLISGRIGGHKIPRPKGRDLAAFITGKAIFFSMAFVLPIIFHKWYIALAIYALAAFVSGVAMAIVFQLAHVVGEAEFPVPHVVSENGVRMDTEWAVHQIQTTVDFSRGNKFLCWFLGGLNFQVEHHLFSRICHIHYPALSKVVEEACRDFGVKYAAHRSIFSAIRSHAQWISEMGQPTTV
jgi:linoleoyl-CoA desaturase